MKLYFTISELLYSDVANKNNISNIPDKNALDNILCLIFYCLQPIRNLIGKPMIITSGYRCSSLNSLVGGVSNSQHTKGEAVDFIVKAMKPNHIIDIIKDSSIEFDQLINEFDKWVHISFSKSKNRKQILKY